MKNLFKKKDKQFPEEPTDLGIIVGTPEEALWNNVKHFPRTCSTLLKRKLICLIFLKRKLAVILVGLTPEFLLKQPVQCPVTLKKNRHLEY